MEIRGDGHDPKKLGRDEVTREGQKDHSIRSKTAGPIDVRELIQIIWGGRIIVIGATFVGSVIVVIVSLMLPDVYRATALLAPSRSEAPGISSSLASQLGGVASLAGINLGGNESDRTALGLEILKSRKFLSEFIERRQILIPLFAGKRWDSTTGALELDPTVYDVSSGEWVRRVSPPKKKVPTLLEAHEEFLKRVLSVSQDQNTGFVSISVDHVSPILAQRWVDWLIEDLNQSVMRSDVTDAQQAIEFLNSQIAATSLAEMKAVFFRMIEEQTKTVMLAKVSPEYLLRTLDPAFVPEEKVSPNRPLICVLGALLSMFIGVLIVTVMDSKRRAEDR